MKVKDNLIGCVLETENPIVIEQFKKNATRYQEIKKKDATKPAEKADKN